MIEGMSTRRERVILELEDKFSRGIAEAAVHTKAFERALRDLNGTTARTKVEVTNVEKPLAGIGNSARTTDRSINQLTGRLALLRDVSLTLGPALAPVGAAGTGALAGLTNQLGFATLALGTAVVAFQGFGDAVEAVNAAALEPTETNLDKARTAMERLSPAARSAAREVARMMPVLTDLQAAAADGVMPGFEESIANLVTLAPRAERLLREVGDVAGGMMADTSESLASDRWAEFFSFLESEARPTLIAIGDTVGSVAHGFAEMWMAFQPINTSFSTGLRDAAASFDAWASSLSQAEGFTDFLAYIQRTGPQVIDALGSLGNAVIQIGVAAAPLGGPALEALEAIGDVVAAIASSEIGTPLIAAAALMATFSRATRLWGAVTQTSAAQAIAGQVGYGGALKSNIALMMRFGAMTRAEVAQQQAATAAVKSTALKTAALFGAVAVASTGAADAVGLQNTATLALAGSMAGPWGAAAGAVVGATMDASAATGELSEEYERLRTSIMGASSSELPMLAQELESANVRLQEYRNELTEAAANGSDLWWNLTNPVQSFKAEWNALEGLFGNSNLEELEADSMSAGQALDASRAKFSLVGASSERMGEAIHQAGLRTSRMTDKMIGARNAARETARGFITLGESLNDSEVSFRGWLKQLERQREALINFRRNAQDAARKGLDQGLIRALQEAGPEGAMRMRQLANASERELARANDAWRGGQREVKRYTNEIGGVPRDVKTSVTADTGNAHRQIAGVKAALSSIPDESVYVNIYNRRPEGSSGFGPQVGSADGGTVPRTGLPYADRHPYLLADGEEVISNRYGQADRHRALLKAINAGRLAEGGTAGGNRPASGGSTGPVDAQARATAEALRGLERQLNQAERAVKRHEKAVDREREQRDKIASMRRDIIDSTAGGLRSDIWAVPEQGDVWASNRAVAMDPLSILRGDIREGIDANRDITRLRRMGLKGQALVSAAEDPDRLDYLLSQGRGYVRQYQAAYNQRQSVTQMAGVTAGDAVMGRELRVANRELAAIKAELKQANQRTARLEKAIDRSSEKTGKAVGDKINGAASTGKRDQRR